MLNPNPRATTGTQVAHVMVMTIKRIAGLVAVAVRGRSFPSTLAWAGGGGGTIGAEGGGLASPAVRELPPDASPPPRLTLSPPFDPSSRAQTPHPARQLAARGGRRAVARLGGTRLAHIAPPTHHTPHTHTHTHTAPYLITPPCHPFPGCLCHPPQLSLCYPYPCVCVCVLSFLSSATSARSSHNREVPKFVLCAAKKNHFGFSMEVELADARPASSASVACCMLHVVAIWIWQIGRDWGNAIA
eukprot:scaffold9107_cov112-Isochrysis_galbana.AAC.3